MDRKKVLAVSGILLAFAGIIFTLVVVRQKTDNFTHAAAPDQLEAEGGVLGGNATVKQDTNASGGQYVLLNNTAVVDCGTSLQAKINSATAGNTLDITGCTYSQGAIVNKSLTLKGGTINVASGQIGLTVTANDVTIDAVQIIGPQSKIYTPNEFGIYVEATAVNPVRNLVIKNSDIGNFGYGSMYLRQVANLTVQNNILHDDVYTGIMVFSGIGGTISGNTVQRIGVYGADANGNNAYGIGLNRIVTNLTSDPFSSDFIVSGNTITDVPTWHAIDTHAGQRITFSGNTIYRASRGIFITGDAANNRASDIIVSGNLLGSPSPVTFNLQLSFNR